MENSLLNSHNFAEVNDYTDEDKMEDLRKSMITFFNDPALTEESVYNLVCNFNGDYNIENIFGRIIHQSFYGSTVSTSKLEITDADVEIREIDDGTFKIVEGRFEADNEGNVLFVCTKGFLYDKDDFFTIGNFSTSGENEYYYVKGKKNKELWNNELHDETDKGEQVLTEGVPWEFIFRKGKLVCKNDPIFSEYLDEKKLGTLIEKMDNEWCSLDEFNLPLNTHIIKLTEEDGLDIIPKIVDDTQKYVKDTLDEKEIKQGGLGWKYVLGFCFLSMVAGTQLGNLKDMVFNGDNKDDISIPSQIQDTSTTRNTLFETTPPPQTITLPQITKPQVSQTNNDLLNETLGEIEKKEKIPTLYNIINYRVKRGEGLYRILKKHGLSYENYAINCINNTKVKSDDIKLKSGDMVEINKITKSYKIIRNGDEIYSGNLKK